MKTTRNHRPGRYVWLTCLQLLDGLFSNSCSHLGRCSWRADTSSKALTDVASDSELNSKASLSEAPFIDIYALLGRNFVASRNQHVADTRWLWDVSFRWHALPDPMKVAIPGNKWQYLRVHFDHLTTRAAYFLAQAHWGVESRDYLPTA